MVALIVFNTAAAASCGEWQLLRSSAPRTKAIFTRNRLSTAERCGFLVVLKSAGELEVRVQSIASKLVF